MKYIYAFDLSLSCIGLSIFNDDGSIRKIVTIETKSEEGHSGKLKFIGNEILKLREIYQPSKIIIEQGFSRFAASTQAIFKVNGVVQYLFYDVEQVFYSPATVKKTVGGRGNMKKDELRNIIIKKYPNIIFRNLDESDSFAVGLTYFYKEGIIK